ncbi:class I SAM-dependent methyltransferase [Amphibacillus cookii]|uniref:class I SAM-dependent methyltransferase n=1 Tax=Amphibacillus cookii TaxID=767787 RepID=UPI001EF7FAD2|nr:class I SAM-dependent methyltransferase [Amphibacillus cookii]MBM7541821.1 ubiquinone/menaquinone biosynthesis C-methylase UbiE [Amphibacillus cookii]
MIEKMKLDNLEEYDDPILYDKENDTYTEDIIFLEKWASKTEGIIVDLACGTGRVTIPLASKGYRVIGVDLHKGMLNEAKNKTSNLNLQIDWVEQDCSKLDLKAKSNLIFSVGNSFQHFLTNDAQDDLLMSVNRHLETNGIFIFGTRFPSAEELFQPSKEEYWKTYIDRDTQNEVDVYTVSSYDPLNQLQHNTTIRKFKNADEEIVNEVKTNITLRYVFPKEMERILTDNCFEIINVYKDWKETPITEDSYQMVYVCRKVKDFKKEK